jgi:hypothetical protein
MALSGAYLCPVFFRVLHPLTPRLAPLEVILIREVLEHWSGLLTGRGCSDVEKEVKSVK